MMKRPSGPKVAMYAFALATLALTAAVIVQCVAIYRTGTSAANVTATGVFVQDMYSREIVAQRFSQIAWVFLIWLATLAAALLCRAVWPTQKQITPAISPETRLSLLLRRVEQTPAMKAEQKKRKLLTAVCAAVCTACATFICAYLLNPAHFASRELEGVMGDLLLAISPWILVAFAALLAHAQLWEHSTVREIEAAKAAPKRTPEPQGQKNNHLVLTARIALLVCAIAMLAAGVLNGGMYDVLVKAVNICTECIGLG